jgi:anthranilate synthase component 1
MTPSAIPSREEFRTLAKEGNVVPLIVDLVADVETPVSAFAKIARKGPCFLFESAERNEQSGRFSYIGFDPMVVFKSAGPKISISESGNTKSFETQSDPLIELQRLIDRFHFVPPRGLPHFTGGAVGYIGYDVVRFFEPTVPIHPLGDLRLPEMMFVIARTLFVFDHRYRTLRLITNAHLDNQTSIDEAFDRAAGQLERALETLNQPIELPAIRAGQLSTLPFVQSNTTREEFESTVLRGKELISAGDIFQVVLSQRFETEFTGDPLDLYRALRFGNPSPYMFCLKFDEDFSAIGSSPELHVRVHKECAEIRPIAGTRQRGKNLSEDEQLARELLLDPKECAEHVMLIDLGRNDLGRIAQFGSVRVTEQMVIERYSHVMHIVSHVTARLREGKNSFDVVRATFPAGTVSGAPKIRAMQIIAELEKARRGFYAGIVGYFGFDGSHESCIAIRSMVLKDKKAFLQTGAGVVADSDPIREYEECINKSKAMIEAIARAERK